MNHMMELTCDEMELLWRGLGWYEDQEYGQVKGLKELAKRLEDECGKIKGKDHESA